MTTGLLIGGASGLACGVALLVWALRERSARAAAESESAAMRDKVEAEHRARVSATHSAVVAEERADRAERQAGVLRAEVDKLSRLVQACVDQDTVREWLENEAQRTF